MDNDDATIGRVLSRREMLGLLGGASVAGVALIAVGCSDDGKPAATSTSTRAAATSGASPQAAATATQASGAIPVSCVVTPALTEGPYFVDEQLLRSDIRSDPSDNSVRPGTPFELTMVVTKVGSDGACTPLAGANVDVWHCDATGVYSDVSDPSFNTKGQKWLRGYQTTDASGRVQFTTIYPGWYQGRATHIHFKVRTEPGSNAGTEFTSQFFFDDALSDIVHDSGGAYAKGAAGRTQNTQDGIYNGGGQQLVLDVQPSGGGYAAAFNIGMTSA